MRATFYCGKNDGRVEEIEEPKVTKRKVKAKVAWCGICGSDLHAYHHGLG